MEKLLILGLGYVGRALRDIYKNQFDILTASRNDEADIKFDLSDPSTWETIPSVENCIWTFPAKPLGDVKRFADGHRDRLGHLVVVGTTGSFLVKQEHEIVNESAQLDLSQEREKGEEYLRLKGACLIHSAGIYGPQRDPRDWVMRGLVGPEDRYVNFIHVEDLCQFLVKGLGSQHSGHRYIASDGCPQRWSDLISTWKQRYNLVLPAEYKMSSRNSKRIDSSESMKRLGVVLKHSSVNEGLWPIGS